MAADREEDRRTPSAAEKDRAESAIVQGSRGGHLREQVHVQAQQLRSGADASESGHGVDRRFDRMVSEAAPHTPGKAGHEVDAQARADLERHRAEMQNAAIAGALRRKKKPVREAAGPAQETGTPAPMRTVRARAQDEPPPGAEAFAKSRRAERREAAQTQARRPAGPPRSKSGIELQANGFARPGPVARGGDGRAAPVRPGELRSRSDIERERGQLREDQARAR